MAIAERRRFESELADLEIIRPDTRARVPVADTLALPYRWICRLVAPSADPTEHGYGMGTGILIGPRHVLTAAHVLVSQKDPRQSVGDWLRVQPARNGTQAPLKEVGIRGWQVDPRWIRRVHGRWVLQSQHDYGLVTLDTDVSTWPIGPCTLGYWGISGPCADGAGVGLSAAEVRGQGVQVTGYPFDNDPTTILDRPRHHQNGRPARVLLHTADTVRGQSGSPVWMTRDGRRDLVGVHSGSQGLSRRRPGQPDADA